MNERRVAPRFQPALGTLCRLDHLNRFGKPTVGLVWDISTSGVSMLLADPPKVGEVVAAELVTESGGPAFRISLKVVHVRAVPTGDYFLGAQFVRSLEAGEIARFLAPPPRPIN